jgi:maltokinase
MADAPAAASFGPAWLVRQRWFRSKARPVASVREIDRAPFGGPRHLVVLGVEYADGGSDRYLVPIVTERDTVREPRDGEGAWTALLEVIATNGELRGARGRFLATATPALPELLPSAPDAAAALRERRLGGEQTNTSVAFDERLILKLYRHLEEGLNPDVEVSAFLTDAGFADTPALAGSIVYLPDDGDTCAAAMLQEYVPSIGDGWATMLTTLADDPERATRIAAEVGALTARLHAALASRPDHPAFPARLASRDDIAAWRASAESQLAQAIETISGEARDRLIDLAPRVRARFEAGFGFATRDTTVSRIHGDFHLGQLLARTDGGFSVIDFEGEPARPLGDRRRPTSPLRDVAGMLRSLDYVARTTELTAAMAAVTWLPEAREAFLGAYGARGPLVEAFELEKALYEVRYEANNRPDWLWLPLGAIERLAA